LFTDLTQGSEWVDDSGRIEGVKMNEKIKASGKLALLTQVNETQKSPNALENVRAELERMNKHRDLPITLKNAQAEIERLNKHLDPPSTLRNVRAELERMNNSQDLRGAVKMVQVEFERMSQIQREGNLAGGDALPLTKLMSENDRMQQRLFGERISALPESEMQAFEELIPELAQIAVKIAHNEALALGATVLEAINGELVETFANGERRFIKSLPAPYKVELGAKRTRRTN
jgi:hypothetical protein